MQAHMTRFVWVRRSIFALTSAHMYYQLPYYLGPLVIDQFSLGKSLPLLKRIGQPYLSDDGFWVDSELAYNGGAIMTIETKININAVKKDGNVSPTSLPKSPDSEHKVWANYLTSKRNTHIQTLIWNWIIFIYESIFIYICALYAKQSATNVKRWNVKWNWIIYPLCMSLLWRWVLSTFWLYIPYLML